MYKYGLIVWNVEGDVGCRALSDSVIDVGEINMAARIDRLSARIPNLFGFLDFYLVSKYV
jgi:hypothetical protein